MNVELNYKRGLYNFDVDPSKPISYIEELAGKVFNLTKEKIYLYFNEQQIMNTNLLIKDFFTHEDKISLKIEGLESLCSSQCPLSLSEMKNKQAWDTLSNKRSYFNPKSSKKEKDRLKGKDKDKDQYNAYSNTKTKTTAILSQDSINTNTISNNTSQCNTCKSNEAVFYCRDCNFFLCPKCQDIDQSHTIHHQLRIEKGNLRQSTLIYKRDLINDIKHAEKDLNESNDNNAFDLDDTIITNEANEVLLCIKKIIAKRDDLFIQIPSTTIKDYRLETLMQNIYAQFPNDDFFNESMESVFKMLNGHERELKSIKEEIRRIKVKSDFKMMIFAIIRDVNTQLEKTFEDINSIYINSMRNNSSSNHCNVIEDIEEFLNRNNEKYSKEFLMKGNSHTHTRLNSFNNYQHESLPMIYKRKGQMERNEEYSSIKLNSPIEKIETCQNFNSNNKGIGNGKGNGINGMRHILSSREQRLPFNYFNHNKYNNSSNGNVNTTTGNDNVNNTTGHDNVEPTNGALLRHLKMNSFASFNTPIKLQNEKSVFNRIETSQLKYRNQQVSFQPQPQLQSQKKNQLEPKGNVASISKSIQITEVNNNNTVGDYAYTNPDANSPSRQMNLKKAFNNQKSLSKVLGLINSVQADPTRLIKKKKRKSNKLDLI